jgi:flagellar basal-body rod modification protein FlgD
MSIDVSTVFGTGAAAVASTDTTATATKSNSLDSQAFLDLLVAQLRNQDPSNPMDSSQLMTQTAQLTTNESLLAISETSRESFALQMRMAAAGLVGQEVTYTDSASATHTGIVTGVSYTAAVPTVTVGSAAVALDSIASVKTPTAATPATTTTTTTTTDDTSTSA